MERTPAEVASSIEIAELFKEYSHFKMISSEFKLRKVQLHDLS